MPGLFDPLTVHHRTLRNRVVCPPMATDRASDRGEVLQKHLAHYAEVAADGPGLLIVEHTYIRRDGKASNGQIGSYDDALIPGLSHLAEVIKDNGALACLQLNHAGAQASEEVIGTQPVGPSAIPCAEEGEMPRSLMVEEIRQLLEAFVDAACRAQDAGFDAVEIHGAHGYLLSEFVSPITNVRSDAYGGSVENRLRFSMEVLRAVRLAVGKDLLVLYRFGANDLVPGGITPDDAVEIAPRLVSAGVDILDISGGLGGSGRAMFKEQGYFVPLAARIQQAVGVPVIGVGNVRDPEYAESVIREGLVDLIAVGRAQLANPNWVADARKALSGA